MANIMSQVKFSNKTSRDSFDLSHKVAFTAKAGELLPIEVKEVIPRDKFVIKPKWYTRTNPLNTAAYTRLTEYVDYYFVPYHLLWNKAEQFFTNIQDSQHATAINNPNNKEFTRHPFFQLSSVINYLRKIDADFYSGRASSYGNKSANYFGFNRAWQSAKLLEYLGYGEFTQYLNDPRNLDNPTNDGSEIELDVDVYLNPFPLLAYQCVYQYYERNTQWENMRADFFNVDYLVNNNSVIPIHLLTENTESDTMFDLRYCNFKKDLFTGLMPNSQYGDESAALVIGNGLVPLDLRTSSGTLLSNINFQLYPYAAGDRGVLGAKNTADETLASLRNINFADSTTIGKLSILALRQAQALQRYKEIKQSNKYDYKSQIEAIWDTNVSKYRAHMPVHIGGFVNGINIDEVVNTSITDSGNERQAANIAGKGAGAGNGYLEFESKEDFGLIIGIYKVAPELDYGQIGLSRLMQKTDFTDYANPLFDKLGMEEVSLSELVPNDKLFPLLQQGLEDGVPTIGYAPRYYDYKTDVDIVRGGFTRDTYSQWVTPVDGQQLLNNFHYNRPLVNFTNFKVNPMYLNPIFVGQIYELVKDEYLNPYYIADWENEQFLVNYFSDFKAIRALDYNGMPY